MSYGMAAALQAAVFQALGANPALTALVGGAIYDVVPAGSLPRLYVSLGPEEARDASDKTGGGARHDFTVSVVSDESGFHQAKTVAAAVNDALLDADLTLSRGRLVSLRFLRARARREGTGQLRRIDILFRARIDEN
ncbi:DUF3168 domain-containing protein [Lutimaribacter sp. EGI FJ00015]|uniref:DUF3168 domain-containing protein n=1 Tax=Lutimaribacter degradans TaxID=2945989 RepID=A0ACC5ZT84_9RHOB|nr:DUF3168 domain-containing protein [Lutimaribacter sp. EGI FJ00013]MCM2561035.1 DUF3168 domain-containing protein [Lutimaribacter sp. EGI FJ00013]MCO0612018.1 DUF3168 domain-containing protein [Lutimaribacter sp. EGI FJ00015]MCO0634862.1 DUF3168 domain-containing protein [Lutimaribacter sp. EGI FJ00014]